MEKISLTTNEIGTMWTQHVHPFMVQFLEHTLKAGLLTLETALITSVRSDIREYFTGTLNNSIQLFNKCMDLALQKGLLIRPPSLTVQPDVEFVESKKYMSMFGNRPLNTIELTHLFENILFNSING